MTTPQPSPIAHRLAQIVAELLPHDADPQLAHALQPVLDGLVAELLTAVLAAVTAETEKQSQRIERHEAWTMERLDERGTTINDLRADQRALRDEVGQLAADVETLKAQAVGEPNDASG